jgi:hypothetical protein
MRLNCGVYEKESGGGGYIANDDSDDNINEDAAVRE